jgi:hypothetical protein
MSMIVGPTSTVRFGELVFKSLLDFIKKNF